VSRIGRLPVTVPAGVQVKVEGNQVTVSNSKVQMVRTFSPEIAIQLDGNNVVVTRGSNEPHLRALHGTTRALIQNMVTGLSTGFTRVLEIDGVGYRAEMNSTNLVLYLGYSHPVEVAPPTGISFEVDTRTRQVKVQGHDKEQVGQIASDIRKVRPPEPYKGKGVHYLGERLKRKAGKAGKTKGKK
jgi:large subunit ribosomal protein L6